jgi:cobalamin biosynthesis Mg chelatase CobN
MNKHRIGALLAAAALTLTFAGTAFAATYATVSGHAAASAESNSADYWSDLYGLDCEKIYDGEGDEIDSWEADADYAVVIVKAAGQNVGDNANTIFENVSEGETVWADTNGNNTFDPGGQDGDKNISHIIVCENEETTTTSTEETTTSTTTEETTTSTTTEETTTTTSTEETTTSTTDETTSTTSNETTPEGSVEELTPPQTDTISQPTSSSSVSTGLLLVLAGILAAVLVVVPAAARNRR